MAPTATPAPTPPAAPSNSKRTASNMSDRQRVEDLEVKPYVIVSDLGKGSFATVYRGYHEVCTSLSYLHSHCLTLVRAANTSPSRDQDRKSQRSQSEVV